MIGLIVDLRDLKALVGGLEMIEEENRALDQARYIYQIKPGTYIRSSQVHILDQARYIYQIKPARWICHFTECNKWFPHNFSKNAQNMFVEF